MSTKKSNKASIDPRVEAVVVLPALGAQISLSRWGVIALLAALGVVVVVVVGTVTLIGILLEWMSPDDAGKLIAAILQQ